MKDACPAGWLGACVKYVSTNPTAGVPARYVPYRPAVLRAFWEFPVPSQRQGFSRFRRGPLLLIVQWRHVKDFHRQAISLLVAFWSEDLRNGMSGLRFGQDQHAPKVPSAPGDPVRVWTAHCARATDILHLLLHSASPGAAASPPGNNCWQQRAEEHESLHVSGGLAGGEFYPYRCDFDQT